jgi:hypothetical protein
MPDPKTPAELPGDAVGKIFRTLVTDSIVPAMRDAGHQSAVDIEIYFKSVTIEKGIVIFPKKTTESQMEIRIATRINPPPD